MNERMIVVFIIMGGIAVIGLIAVWIFDRSPTHKHRRP